MEAQTANPDILLIDDVYFMYFRGQQGGHDRIGLATVRESAFDGVTWEIHAEPVIDVGQPGDPDEIHVLDPAALIIRLFPPAKSEIAVDFCHYDRSEH